MIKKISAIKFAEDMGGKSKGYSKGTVYTWKTNRSTSYMNDIESIAEYLSVTPEYLLTGIIDTSTNDINIEIAKLTSAKRKQAEQFIRFLKTQGDFSQEVSDALSISKMKPLQE